MEREELNKENTLKLVGFIPTNKNQSLVAGSHFFEKGQTENLENDQGWMSSVAFSPMLKHSIGLDNVITFGAGHFYVSQSDKGGLVFGGDIDGYNSYAQRGNLPVIEDVCEGGVALMPMIGRARLLRTWGGIKLLQR